MQPQPEPPPASHADRTCANCGRLLAGSFCANCGQRDEPLRLTVRHFFSHAVTEYFGVDGRMWQTLRRLLFQPGLLTAEFLAGRRVRYLRPLRVYLTASLFFFFLLSIIDPVARFQGESTRAMAADSTITVAARAAVIDSLLSDLTEKSRTRQQAAIAATRARDSLAAAISSDSLAGVTVDTVAELQRTELARLRREVRRARERWDDALRDERERAGPLQWQLSVLDTLSADSLIRPINLADAASLLFQVKPEEASGMADQDWFGLKKKGSVSDQLRNARTPEERSDAFRSVARSGLDRLPVIIFLMLPVFALLLKLLYIRSDWVYTDHLVFAFHTHAFLFVILFLSAIISLIENQAIWAGVLSIGLQATLPIYFVMAQKRVYRQGWLKTLVKAVALASFYQIVVMAIISAAIVLLFAGVI